MSYRGLVLRAGFALALTLLAAQPTLRAQSAKRKARDAETKVMTAGEAAAASAKASEFLRVPGTSRYDTDGIDWRDVPPWKQAAFFGIRAKGQVFIYVVDCSGSMIDEDRLVRAKLELRRSVLNLQPPQRFKILFYNDQIVPMPGDLPLSADWSSKERLIHWLRLIEPDGSTDPRGALSLAVSLRPDAIFLLSDGAFPDGTAEAVAKRNSRRIPIHCVDLSGGAGGDHLRRIARDSGGQYRSAPPTNGPG